MIERNSIHHYLSDTGIRLTLVDVTGAANYTKDIHHLNETAAIILSEVMAGTAIMATDFKNHEGVSMRWVTNSPIGTIHTDAFDGRFVRGYMDHPEKAEGDKASLINSKGVLYVTRYSLLKMPHVSSVNLTGNTVSDCLTYYLNESDQTLSHIETAVKFKDDGTIERAMGFMAQFMPEGNRKVFDEVFTNKTYDFWNTDENDPSTLDGLMKKLDFHLLGESSMDFKCTCSEERIKNALVSLRRVDRAEILKDEFVEANCQYCGKQYRIPRDVVKKWFDEADRQKGVKTDE